jgi:predicted DNA-binding ribbon-helix-helix protein
MSSATTSIKVPKTLRDELKACAETRGITLVALIHEWVKRERRRLFFAESETALAAMRQDAQAWEAHRRENEALDALAGEGLDADPRNGK